MKTYVVTVTGHAECRTPDGQTVNADFNYPVTIEAEDANEAENVAQELADSLIHQLEITSSSATAWEME